MADQTPTEDAVFRIFIKADIQRVWRELTKQGEAQGAVFNAWLHSPARSVPACRSRCAPPAADM
jgi:hypothetical protein